MGRRKAAAEDVQPSAAAVPGLQRWLLSAGIWWDPALLAIASDTSHCSGPALRMEAAADIAEGALLCVIPKASVLSRRTTSLAALLEAEQLGGGLALTIAAMYEAALGKESFWHGYIASLPPGEYLPMFWSPEEEAAAAGTQLGLEGGGGPDREDTASDYQEHVVPLMEGHPGVFTRQVRARCGLDAYRSAASWVASRAFYVDAWHGDALVPLADVFNHKASVVALNPDYVVGELRDRGGDTGIDQSNGQHPEVDQAEGVNGDARRKRGRLPTDQQQQQKQQEEEEEGLQRQKKQKGGQQQEGRSKQDKQQQVDAGSHGQANGTTKQPMSSQQQQQQQQEQQFVMVGGPGSSQPSVPATHGGARPAILSASSAAAWQRDGLNLRLEIGICSCGPEGSPGDTTSSDESDAEDSSMEGEEVDEGEGEEEEEEEEECGEGDNCNHHHHHHHHRTQEQQQEEGCRAAAGAGVSPAHLPGDPTTPTPAPPHPLPLQRLEIVAASSVPAGAEVHNTYGELSNVELVRKYGFALSANPFDELPLAAGWEEAVGELVAAAGAGAAGGGKGKVQKAGSNAAAGHRQQQKEDTEEEEQQAAAAAVLVAAGGERQLRRRLRWLRTHSGLLDRDDAADPPALLPHARLPPATYAVLRVLCADEEVFGTWHSMQDALAGTPAAAGLGGGEGAPSASGCAGGGGVEEGEEEEKQEEEGVAGRFQEVPIVLPVQHHTANGSSGSSSGCKQSMLVWTRPMLQLLAALVAARRRAYPPGVNVDQDRRELTRLTKAGDRGEGAAAARAVLQLRLGELTLLGAAEAAIRDALAQLAA